MPNEWECFECGEMNPGNRDFCRHCATPRSKENKPLMSADAEEELWKRVYDRPEATGK